MANANVAAPKGFVPVRHLDGSAWNGQTVDFLCDSGDGTAIFVGDPVKFAGSSGAAGQVVAGYDCEGMATIQVDTGGTSGQSTIGVVVGFSVDPDSLMTKYRKASTSRIAHVVVDTSVVYQIQEDADTTPVAATAIGGNASYTTTAGNTVTGISKNALDSSAVATTNTFPLKLIGLSKIVGNSFNTAGSLLDFATFDVVWNTGQLMPNIIGT